jgi:histidyl-tRNA synthetase
MAFRVEYYNIDGGWRVVQHCGGGSFKSQLRKADASGALVAVILGEEEATAGEATVKPLREQRDQVRVAIERLCETVGALLQKTKGNP